jgi:hypothetical protein
VGAACGRGGYDLQTVVTHELGHLLDNLDSESSGRLADALLSARAGEYAAPQEDLTTLILDPRQTQRLKDLDELFASLDEEEEDEE